MVMILVTHDRDALYLYVESSAFNPLLPLELYPTEEQTHEAIKTLGGGRVLLEDYLRDYSEREVIHHTPNRIALTGIAKSPRYAEDMISNTLHRLGENFSNFIHNEMHRNGSKRNESKHGRRDIKRTVKGNQYPLPKRPRGMPKW